MNTVHTHLRITRTTSYGPEVDEMRAGKFGQGG